MKFRISKLLPVIIPLALFIGLSLIVCRSYSFGTVNHYEILPVQYRIDNPNYLPTDVYVNAQSGFNVRTIFCGVMWFMHAVSGLSYPWIYFLFYFSTTLLFFWTMWLWAGMISKKLLYRSIVTILLYFSWHFSVGSTILISNELLPSSFAIPLLFAGIYFALKKNWSVAAVMLAVSTIFHVLQGLLGFGIAGCIILWQFRKDLLKVVYFAAIFLALSAISWLPLVISMFKASGVDSTLVGFVVGNFRNPHHYIPSTWPVWSLVRFFLLEVLAILGLVFLGKKDSKRKDLWQNLGIILIITNLMFLIGYVFVDLIPVTTIIKLQLWRISLVNEIVVKFIFAAIFIIALKWSLDIIKQKYGEKIQNIIQLLLSVTVAFIVIVSAFLSFHKIDIYEKPAYKSNQIMYEWIQKNTSPDSYFLTSAFLEDFRTKAMRGQVIVFKAFTFEDKMIIEWYRRVVDLCGQKDPPACSGWSCWSYCDKKYRGYTWEELQRLAKKYHTNYILTETEYIDGKPFIVKRVDNFFLYQVK